MISLVDFDTHSEWVLPRLMAIGARSNRRRLHIDIQEACYQKRAFLFVDGQQFIVLKPFVRDGLIIVLVWAAYSKTGDAMEKHQATIERYAKAIGATALEFYTARKGYDRLAPRHGWKKAFTVWTKDL